MDRPLEIAVRRKRIIRRAGITILVVAGAVMLLASASSFIRPSLRRSNIRTAVVDEGPIASTISAAGTVVPEFEHVLSSPVEARVVRILKKPGAVLHTGDPILQLDLNESVLALERLRQNLALKDNQQERVKLDLESTLSAVAGQVQIKGLELQNMKAITLRDRTLFDEGLVSREALRQSELNEARATVELKQLENSETIARRAADTQLRGLELEMSTLRKERVESERQLELATTKADRDGVLTYVVSEEGVTARKGDVIARIADLTSFRVDATISDVHAAKLTPGMPAQIDVNGAILTGAVTRVLPAIENGVVTMAIALDDSSNKALRSNLHVDVRLVLGRKEHALRVKKGTFTGREGIPEAFVVKGGWAVRRPVTLGISDFDRFEILDGLSAGDEVIVSDTSEFQHMKEIRVR